MTLRTALIAAFEICQAHRFSVRYPRVMQNFDAGEMLADIHAASDAELAAAADDMRGIAAETGKEARAQAAIARQMARPDAAQKSASYDEIAAACEAASAA